MDQYINWTGYNVGGAPYMFLSAVAIIELKIVIEKENNKKSGSKEPTLKDHREHCKYLLNQGIQKYGFNQILLQGPPGEPEYEFQAIRDMTIFRDYPTWSVPPVKAETFLTNFRYCIMHIFLKVFIFMIQPIQRYGIYFFIATVLCCFSYLGGPK